jgi:hypothetical protein
MQQRGRNRVKLKKFDQGARNQQISDETRIKTLLSRLDEFRQSLKKFP